MVSHWDILRADRKKLNFDYVNFYVSVRGQYTKKTQEPKFIYLGNRIDTLSISFGSFSISNVDSCEIILYFCIQVVWLTIPSEIKSRIEFDFFVGNIF